jgi:hypothetical protein
MRGYVTAFCGWETGGLEEAYSTNGSPTVANTSPAPMHGGYYLKLGGSLYHYRLLISQVESNPQWMSAIPTVLDNGARWNHFGFRCYLATTGDGGSVSIYDRSAFPGTYNAIIVKVQGAAGANTVTVEGGGAGSITLTSAVPLGRWFYVEVAFRHVNSSHTCYAWIDGVQVSGSLTPWGTNNTDNWCQLAEFRQYAGTPCFDDFYFQVGSDNYTERLGEFGQELIVTKYGTPQNTSNSYYGSSLSTGTWLNMNDVPANSGTEASMTPNPWTGIQSTEGFIYEKTYGKFSAKLARNAGNSVVGMKFCGNFKRGSGGGTPHEIIFSTNNSYFTSTLPLPALTTSYATYQNIAMPGTAWGQGQYSYAPTPSVWWKFLNGKDRFGFDVNSTGGYHIWFKRLGVPRMRESYGDELPRSPPIYKDLSSYVYGSTSYLTKLSEGTDGDQKIALIFSDSAGDFCVYSTDGGETWNKSAALSVNVGTDQIAFVGGNLVNVGSGGGSCFGIYSSDNGATWHDATTQPNKAGAWGMRSFVVCNGRAIMSASDFATSTGWTAYSSDGGVNWTVGATWTACWQMSLSVDFLRNKIYCRGRFTGGTDRVWVSTDYGANWNTMTNEPRYVGAASNPNEAPFLIRGGVLAMSSGTSGWAGSALMSFCFDDLTYVTGDGTSTEQAMENYQGDDVYHSMGQHLNDDGSFVWWGSYWSNDFSIRISSSFYAGFYIGGNQDLFCNDLWPMLLERREVLAGRIQKTGPKKPAAQRRLRV